MSPRTVYACRRCGLAVTVCTPNAEVWHPCPKRNHTNQPLDPVTQQSQPTPDPTM